jgi:hypothetical protein
MLYGSTANAQDSGQQQAPVPSYVLAHVPQASLTGQGRMTYLMWDVYDATLYAPAGRYQPNQPYALSLTYLRSLEGRAIADRSVEEMRTQGFSNEIKLAQWHSQMRSIFPDVSAGNTLTGVATREGHTRFYRDGKLIGEIADSQFTETFFNIWLSPKTTAPNLRKALIGLDRTLQEIKP